MTTENTPKTRDSNLELLRIVTMLLIIAHHYVVNSGLTDAAGGIYENVLAPQSIFLLLLGAWGKTGINCFVLITGYFMCQSRITAKKYAKLLGEVMFYRVVIRSVFWISGYDAFSLGELVKVLIPVREIGTGFTNAFLVFYLFIPFLNLFVRSMNEKQHISVLLLCGFTYVVLGTFHKVTMNYVSWFMVLYLIAAYIRLYPKALFSNRKFWCLAMWGSIVLSACSVVACSVVYAKFHRLSPHMFVIDSNTFLAVLTGVCTFQYFRNLSVPYSRVINAFGASTFGVLLIHANGDVMRRWLWEDFLNTVGAWSQPWVYAHALLSVVLIFLICAGIDMLRIRWIEKPFLALWDRNWDGIQRRWNRVEAAVCQWLNIGK